MKQLKYIGNHRPKGMVIEAEEKDVERLLNSGEYEELDKQSKEVKVIKKKIEGENGNNSIKSSKRL